MSRDKEDIISLMDEFENSPERALFLQLEALGSSYVVFTGNYRELVVLLGVVENQRVAIHLSDVKRRNEFLRVFEELTRLLHNFTASAKTLIDHTRTHIHRLYDGQPFVNEYESKIAEKFTSSPIQRFVQDLRNYTQHYTLPAVGRSMSWSRGQEYYNIMYYLDVKELRKWGNWSPESQQYIDAFREKLSLKQLADDYFSLVNEFYRWLDRREREINSEKLDRYRQIQKRIASMLEKE
jgi:hypothetical protein